MIQTKVMSNFHIDATVITNLLQVAPTSSSDKEKKNGTYASMIRTKKEKYVTKNGEIKAAPFFSANGLRGALREVLGSAIFSELEKKDGQKISPDTVHVYSAGGGTSKNNFVSLFDKKPSYAEIQRFKEKNPFISVFGAGLSDIDGKLSICNLSLVEKENKAVDSLFSVRFDALERNTLFTPLLDEEAVENYKEEIKKVREANKDVLKAQTNYDKANKKYMQAVADDASDVTLEKLKEEKEATKIKLDEIMVDKGMSFQQIYQAEYIIPGTKLSSSVSTRGGYELSSIENGMLLYGLILLSQKNIGSYSRIGWGALDWVIKNANNEILFTTTCDKRYFLTKDTKITDEGEKVLKPFRDWLSNLRREDIAL